VEWNIDQKMTVGTPSPRGGGLQRWSDLWWKWWRSWWCEELIIIIMAPDW